MKTASGKQKKGTAVASSKGNRGPTEASHGYPDEEASSPSSINYDNAGPVVDSDGETDDGKEWCICHGPDDGRKMINCDGCQNWFHLMCLKIPDHMGDLIMDFYCPTCTNHSHRTMYRPHCTLRNCMKPARLELYPGGAWKYCSDAHGYKYAERTAELARKDKFLTRGGLITQGELLSMLEQTDSLEDFKKLGRKPRFNVDRLKSSRSKEVEPKDDVKIKEEVVSTTIQQTSDNVPMASIEERPHGNGFEPQPMEVDEVAEETMIDIEPLHIRGGEHDEEMLDALDDYHDPSQWDEHLLNEDEMMRMIDITSAKESAKNRYRLYKTKNSMLDSMKEKNAILLSRIKAIDSSYRVVCGFNSAFALNEAQFAAFTEVNEGGGFEIPDVSATCLTAGDKLFTSYPRADGIEEFHSICLRKKCPKHGDWQRMYKEDARYQAFLANKTVSHLEAEENIIREVAQVRALSDNS